MNSTWLVGCLQCRQKWPHVFSQTIYGNANICIGVLFNRDRTTFKITLFRLQESCRDKKSLLVLCRPKSKLQEGKSGSGK